MTGFAGALQFLTRVPVRTRLAPNLTRSVPWFPVVGALVGVVVGALAWSLHTPLGPLLAAVLAVLAGVLVTGAFHEDGLADVADAFAGGWTREDRFRILKDPLHGSYGVAALSGTILLRTVALGSVADARIAAAGAVAAHTLGRTVAVAAMALAPTARPDGLGADYARVLRPAPALAGVAAGLGLVALAVGWWAGPLLGAGAAAGAVVSALALRKLGGITGDVLGAVEQIVECAALVTVVALARHHAVWWA